MTSTPGLTYCPRCDLHNCGHITGASERYDASLRNPVGPKIEANIPGVCAGCDETPIAPGDTIQHSTDAGGWIATCCQED